MHFYQHNIKDFNAGTMRMTQLERWLYRDMLEVIYDTEAPLPADLAVVCKKVGARSDEQKAIVAELLADKFELTEHGYVNDRCDREISAYHSKATTAQENGGKAAARHHAGEGMLYAVRFSADGVRLGVTSNMKSRLSQLRGQYGKGAFVVHKVVVAHMGDALAEVLAAYGDARSGEELPIAEGDESHLVSLMDRIDVASGSHQGRMPVASGSHSNHEPVTNKSSVPNGTDAGASSDLSGKQGDSQSTDGAMPTTKEQIWYAGKSLLMIGGTDKAQAGAFVGKLVKDYTEPVVLEAVQAAVVAQPADPRAYLKAACQRIAGERLPVTTAKPSRYNNLAAQDYSME